jgi:hypothetical protein
MMEALSGLPPSTVPNSARVHHPALHIVLYTFEMAHPTTTN